MTLIFVIDFLVVAGLVATVFTGGLESALPIFAFILVLIPLGSVIQVPGLFDFTTARIAILTFSICYLAVGRNRAAISDAQGNSISYLMLLAVAWGLVSTTQSIVPETSLKATLAQLLDLFCVYYLFRRNISKPETVHKILMAITAAMAVCCVFGYLETYHGWSVLSLFPARERRNPGGNGLMFDLQRGLRATATFPHPILFGSALAMGIPQVVYLLTLPRSGRYKLFLWVTIMLMFLNAFKTASRGPWLGVVLACVLLSVFSEAKARKNLLVIVFLTVAVLVIRPGVWDTIKNTYTATSDPDTEEGISYEGRWDLIRLGRQAISRSFSREVLGYGPESFAFLGLETENGEGHIVPVTSCDNSWLAALVETGYVGLFLLATLIFTGMAITFKSFRALPGPGKQICGLLFVNQVTFAFMMLGVATYGWGQQTSIFLIVLAAAVRYPCLLLDQNQAQLNDLAENAEGDRLFFEAGRALIS